MQNLPPLVRAAYALACTSLLFLALACDSGTASPTPISPTAAVVLPTSPPANTAVPTNPAAPPTDTPGVLTEAAAPTTAPTSAPPTDTASIPTQAIAAPTDTRSAPTAAPPANTHAPLPTRAATPRMQATLAATRQPAATRGTQVTPAPVPSRVAADMSQVVRVPPGKHRIALTFDAGSTTGHVPEILAALARHNAHITFFVTGQWAEQNPDQLRAIVAAGDEVANHSYSHPSFPKLTDEQMLAELDKAEGVISGITGLSTKPYWRPPFGDETGHVLDLTSAHGYRSIFWTLDSLDSIGKPKTKDFILNRVTNASINLDGAIILQHVASDPSSEALPEILDRLYAKGLTVVTITGLLSP